MLLCTIVCFVMKCGSYFIVSTGHNQQSRLRTSDARRNKVTVRLKSTTGYARDKRLTFCQIDDAIAFLA